MEDQNTSLKKQPHQLLADALTEAKKKSRDHIVKSSDLGRYSRERLIKSDCLTEIIRGWYLLTSPGGAGGSTAWFEGFWAFLKHYLSDRFGVKGYCLNAECSLSLHAADSVIPKQLIVLTNKASNQNIDLLHETSILLYHHEGSPFPTKMKKYNGVNIMLLEQSLCRLTPSYFTNRPLNVEIALKQIRSVSDVSRILLSEDLVKSAERLAGAFNILDQPKKGAQIVDDMRATGRTIAPLNPFKKYSPCLSGNLLPSPYVGRIQAMWKSMREKVIEQFPPAPTQKINKVSSLNIIERMYTEDAYHSLSIEGYQVTEELIKTIADGKWDPLNNDDDRGQRDALAAKGYSESFKSVMKSLAKVLDGEDPGVVLEDDLQSWYRELFSPLQQANLLNSSDLAGFRNQPVYIRSSRHVPPHHTAILDAMGVLIDLLKNETEASVRAVLGHFVFVFIHPYMDGNGRMGRFLMNLMLVSGNYNWTVIRTSERARYMASLESASTKGQIDDFIEFIATEMIYWGEQIDTKYSI